MLIFFLIPAFMKHPKVCFSVLPETQCAYTSMFYSLHFYLHLIKLTVMFLFSLNAKESTASCGTLSRKHCCHCGSLTKGGISLNLRLVWANDELQASRGSKQVSKTKHAKSLKKKKWSVAFILSIKEVRFGKMLKYLSNFQMKKVTYYSKFLILFIRFYDLISSKSFIFFEFLFYNILFFMYENFAYTMCVPGACGDKKVQHPLLLNYSCEPLCMWVQETGPGSPARAVGALDHQPSLQPLLTVSYTSSPYTSSLPLPSTTADL